MPTLIAYPYATRDAFALSDPSIESTGAAPANMWQAVNVEDGTHWLDFEPVSNNSRTVFEFDLSSLPAGAIPTGVSIEFCIERGGGSTSALHVRSCAVDGGGALILGPNERPVRGASGPPRSEHLPRRRTLAHGEAWANYGNVCAEVFTDRGSDLTGTKGHFCRLIWIRALVEYAGAPPAAVSPTLSGTIAVPTECGWRYEQEDGVPQQSYRVAIATEADAAAGGFDPETHTGWLFDTGRTQGASIRSVSLAANPLPDGDFRQYVKVWGRLSDGTIVASAWVNAAFTVANAPARPQPPMAVAGNGWDQYRGGAAVVVDPLGAGSSIQMQRSIDGGATWADISTTGRGYDYERAIAKHSPTHLFDAMDLATPADTTLPNRGSADGLLRFDPTNPGVRLNTVSRPFIYLPDSQSASTLNSVRLDDAALGAAQNVSVVEWSMTDQEVDATYGCPVALTGSGGGRILIYIGPTGGITNFYAGGTLGSQSFGAPAGDNPLESDLCRMTVTWDDGGGNVVAVFATGVGEYGDFDGAVWTDQQTVTTAGTAVCPNGTADLWVGSNGSVYSIRGRHYGARYQNVGNTPVVSDPGADGFPAGHTISRSTTGVTVELVGRSVWVGDRPSDSFATLDDALTLIGDKQPATIVQVVHGYDSDNTVNVTLATRDSTNGATVEAGIVFRFDPGTGVRTFKTIISDGLIVEGITTIGDLAHGQVGAIGIRYDGDTITGFVHDGTTLTTVELTGVTFAEFEHTAGWHVGNNSGTNRAMGQGAMSIPFAAFEKALSDTDLDALLPAMIDAGTANPVRDFGVPFETPALYRARTVNTDGDAVSDWVQSATPTKIMPPDISTTDPDGRPNGWWALVPGDQTLNLQPTPATVERTRVRNSAVVRSPRGNSVTTSPSLGDDLAVTVYAKDRPQREAIERLIDAGLPFRLVDLYGRGPWVKVAGSTSFDWWVTKPRSYETTELGDFHTLKFAVIEVNEPRP